MSGHIRSIVPQRGGVAPMDNDTIFFAPFKEHANDVIASAKPIGNKSSLSFDGVGTYVDIGNPGLSALTSCTIEFWCKTNSMANWLLLKGQDGSKYLMAITTGSFYHSSAAEPVIYRDGEIATSLLRDGNWHHYAAVGVNLSTWTTATIGGYSSFHLHGSLENVRVWNRSLTQKEVRALANEGTSHENMSELIADWKLNEGEGSLVCDYSSNGYDGVIIAGTWVEGRSIYSLGEDGVLLEEGTSNLIPNPQINSYPTIGNGWGTYQTNQYNSNVSFSIGTIESVVNNVVTLNPVGRAISTYDVLNPDTTGGGVTAGTEYFIKKHSTNSFSLHAYDSSQDGSKGFRVHDSIKNDIRVTISATDFPTMWHGNPHRPNSGLVKEIIPNGFDYEGRVHDCLRLYTNYKTEGAVGDYLAYGITPPIVAGLIYTVSFYYKAVTAETIGRNVGLSFHTAGTSFGGVSFILDENWQRHTTTFTAPTTGNTNFYINAGSGVVWDLSEIQIEQKNHATSFVIGSRGSNNLKYSIPINTNYFTLNFWAKSIPPAEWYISIFAPDESNRLFIRPEGSTGLGGGRVVGGAIYHIGSGSVSDVNFWHMYSITSSGTDMKMYQDGVLISSNTVALLPEHQNAILDLDPYSNESAIFDEVRIDKIARTEAEIQAWYYQGRNGW